MIKPRALAPGSRLAAVSLSWGGPGIFPYRYEAGKRQLEEEFGVTLHPTPHALRSAEWLHRNPKARAEDLLAAFEDDSIDGIISTIGGDDSIRTLPFMDAELIRKTLFSTQPIGLIQPNESGWTTEHLDWSDPKHQTRKRKLQPCTGWRFHQQAGSTTGHLFGGCLEVLEWLRGTPFWPAQDQLAGAILFLETSEEMPPPSALTRFLRSLGAMGTLGSLAGILVGRPAGAIDPARFAAYEEAVIDTLRIEHGLTDIPVVTNMDFGHTDPMFLLPYGIRARIDSTRKTVSLEESGVVSGPTR